ncbi:IS3 family transposase [Williamsia muralis]|uniref:Integrase catalytic domain-containing protein n=1 Tax=Williamsia marianensis TaxID=85044 RepID=A0A2G3PRT0_WILMA|nr:IS3 family transposase [Williamsia marianensis]PHV68460.1 hypothetical protein CSW57_04385 [Williamsia marianensis]
MVQIPSLSTRLGQRASDQRRTQHIHADDPAFGYRFIADELPEHGIVAGENRVARLCSQEQIWSVFSKKRGLNRKSGPPVHDDLIDRKVTADKPNQVLLTDITEHWTDEGKLYLCAIKDLYSNKIVGYSIDSRMKASLAVRALRNAVDQRDPGARDRPLRSWQPIPIEIIRKRAVPQQFEGSIGRVWACGDNAAMESFFALLQKNVLDRQRWFSREQSRLAIVIWIERTCHHKRRQRRLGRLTPIEFKTINQTATAA